MKLLLLVSFVLACIAVVAVLQRVCRTGENSVVYQWGLADYIFQTSFEYSKNLSYNYFRLDGC